MNELLTIFEFFTSRLSYTHEFSLMCLQDSCVETQIKTKLHYRESMDKKVVREAVKRHGLALQYASVELVTELITELVKDKGVVLEAAKQTISCENRTTFGRVEIVSERATPAAVRETTVPTVFSHLLEQAIATCEKHERLDIITTYLCNLHVSPKEVYEIANDLEHIVHLQDDITAMFVPIRY